MYEYEESAAPQRDISPLSMFPMPSAAGGMPMGVVSKSAPPPPPISQPQPQEIERQQQQQPTTEQRPEQPVVQQPGQQQGQEGQPSRLPGKGVDYTLIPAMLDKEVERLDPDNALHATIIKPGDYWVRTSQKGLLSSPTSTTLWQNDQVTEQKKAFDLLEALSKSGVLPFNNCEVHIVIGSTQSFDETLMNTVIQKNKNPIDSMERSSLIIATTVLGKPAKELVKAEQVPRLAGIAPNLFPNVTPDS
jgi:hypothetical protein